MLRNKLPLFQNFCFFFCMRSTYQTTLIHWRNMSEAFKAQEWAAVFCLIYKSDLLVPTHTISLQISFEKFCFIYIINKLLVSAPALFIDNLKLYTNLPFNPDRSPHKHQLKPTFIYRTPLPLYTNAPTGTYQHHLQDYESQYIC